MKRLGFHIQILLLVFTLALQGEALASINDLIKCSSAIIYARKGGYDTLNNLSLMVEEAIRHDGNQSLINNHTLACDMLKRNIQTGKSVPQPTYLAQIASLPVGEGVKKLFSGFAKPTYQCEIIGGHFGATLYVLGFNAALDLAVCNSTLGNTWLELRPGGELAFGPGFGVNVGLQTGWDHEQSYSSSIIGFTPRVSFNLLAILGFQIVSRGLRDINTFGIDFGFGAKMNFGFGGQINFMVIPLGTNYDHLKLNFLQ